MASLSEETHNRIRFLCAQGDEFAGMDDYPAALEQYWAAWDLLPEPQTDWEAGTWILGAVGDANFLSEDYAAGVDNLLLAMHCPNAIGNPFLHLRLGQCQFELNALDRAADELARAYMGAGSELFDDEEPKYFAFLKTRLEPPPGGW
ncbi:tetratricopeptide repeat protein [Frigoriglobus tundricola]|uniref:TPR domain protein n=1 Tax=Frigoriglobus tundricola TaxID=2774151 RepID=A0A6M5YZ36_9BACT|nr:tetratricopeptide repeat protein [Frigoriglobus tundricola]QJW99299.1 TPR domain protein [Frigoriglobus tundricola]